jgi:hypothetical protein
VTFNSEKAEMTMTPSVHIAILNKSLEKICNPHVLRFIALMNCFCDAYQWRSEMHFDNGRNVSELGTLWQQGLQKYIRDSLPDRRKRKDGRINWRISQNLVAFARATHAIADFYSHTNWVELHAPRICPAPILKDEWSNNDFPTDLNSGFFSLRYGLAGCPSRNGIFTPPAGFTSCHALLNKDSPDKGHGAESLSASAMTYHELAVSHAIASTRELSDLLTTAHGSAFWN